MASVSNLEKLRGGKPAPLTTRRFFSGLFTLRSPLNEPGDGSSTRYYEAIAGAKSDALLGGLNMEVSNKNTLVTRPGFSLFHNDATSTAIGVYSAVMPAGTSVLYDNTTDITTSPSLTIYIKPSSAVGQHTRMLTVGNYTFLGTANEPNPRVWDGSSGIVDYLGIIAPAVAPSISPNAGSGMTANTGWQYVYCYNSPKYTHVSTASPVSASSGPGTWASITVSGPRSTDPQVTQIQIYRTPDGGSTFEFLGQVANPASGNFTYTDTAHDSSLNPFILAPQNGANNPPLANAAGSSGWAYYAGRLWYGVANTLYFSGGPDTTNGNGLMAFPTSNYFTFPDSIQRLVPYANGLLVFTTKDIWAILGTSATTFYPKLQQSGLGVNQWFCVDVNGSEIYVFTNRRQFVMISPSSGVVDVGFPIGDKLGAFNPATTYVAYYTNGEDDGVYVCDGSSQIYRMNPHQYPEGNICWSPVSQPVGGCYYLIAGYDSTNTPTLFTLDSSRFNVLKRNTAVTQDNGSSYASNVAIGPISLAMPGDLALVRSVTVESSAVGNRPSVSVLTNEVSGSFTTLTNFVADPPQLPAFSSYHSDRYYINQSESGLCRQVQLQISYATENAQHEIYGFSVYGELKPNE